MLPQVDYENLVRDLEDRLEGAERRLEAQQRECYDKVDSATELAEKQNALTMTLEAKVTPPALFRVDCGRVCFLTLNACLSRRISVNFCVC